MVEVTLIEIFGLAGLVILGLMTLLWLVSLLVKDASIVDIFWGIGFVISGWIYYGLTPDGFVTRKLLLMVLVTVWGLRLAIHIGRRNLGKGEEDYRYRQWREEHGQRWWYRSYFQVFFLQGFLMWIISLPLLAAQFYGEPGRLTWLDGLGALLWLVGFYFEAVGDWQLTRFLADPANKGKLLTTGVWRYTRHPNYFGDAAQWWGFYLFALATGSGWWTFISPLIMSLLLRFVSGVTMLEKNMKDSKPGYAEYVASTNAFIPWFPMLKRASR
jgi:steroid 5-alpha reductase family enzyme